VLKLSNKVRYALSALFDIAFLGGGEAAQVKDIAERQEIPVRFLEQILVDLKRAGLVAAKRGPSGGYRLARPPADISLVAVIEALDGPLALSSGKGTAGPRRRIALDTHRVTESVMVDLGKALVGCIASVSLADLCHRAEAFGIPRPDDPGPFVYMI